jgi:vacuolar iron transporter family protein
VSEPTQKSSPAHFKGKDALSHVIDAQALGIISAAEVHGIEPPGHLSAGADAARETALLLLFVWLLLSAFKVEEPLHYLEIISCGWLVWKTGRSAWLAWFRLERLHRILAQEKWEIEHHRQQERDELRVLYAAKGFEGKLLEDVLDVLMADNDRLLKIMVEEELGLTLAAFEHPLKQAAGAGLGVLLSACICLGALLIVQPWGILWGILCGAAAVVAGASLFSAHLAMNKFIPAMIWNLGIAGLALGTVYFLMKMSGT